MSTSDGARPNRTHMAALVSEHFIGSQELALSLDSVTRLIALAEAAYMEGKNDASAPDLLAALQTCASALMLIGDGTTKYSALATKAYGIAQAALAKASA